jgi:hypothetical protein
MNAAAAVVAPPSMSPPVKIVSEPRREIGPRHPGEVSANALFHVQAEPESECPATSAATAQIATSTPPAAATAPATAATAYGASGSVRIRRMRGSAATSRGIPALSSGRWT